MCLHLFEQGNYSVGRFQSSLIDSIGRLLFCFFFKSYRFCFKTNFYPHKISYMYTMYLNQIHHKLPLKAFLDPNSTSIPFPTSYSSFLKKKKKKYKPLSPVSVPVCAWVWDIRSLGCGMFTGVWDLHWAVYQ